MYSITQLNISTAKNKYKPVLVQGINPQKHCNARLNILKKDTLSFKAKGFSIDPQIDVLLKDKSIKSEIIQETESVKSISAVKNQIGGEKVLVWGSGNLGFGVLLDSILQNSKSGKKIDIKMVIPRISNKTAECLLPIHRFGGTVIKNSLNGEKNFIELSQDNFIPQWNSEKVDEEIKKSDTIVITIPDLPKARKEIFDKIESAKLNNKTLILMPGGEGGVIEAARRIAKAGSNVTVGLVETAPYGCRMNGILDAKRKSQVNVAAFPQAETNKVISKLNKIFPLTERDKKTMNFNPVSPLDIILGGQNYIYHCAVVLDPDNLKRSIGMLYKDSKYANPPEGETEESFEQNVKKSYNHYLEGITPEIAEVMEALDKERMEIAKALELNAEPLNKALDRHYKIGYHEKYYDAFQACKGIYNSRPTIANELASHRYVIEDLPGMAVIEKLGKIAGVETPVTSMVYKALHWNARQIGTQDDDLKGYSEALKELPDRKDELMRYFSNPKEYKAQEKQLPRFFLKVVPF